MNLRDIARAHETEYATFYLMPYDTLQRDITYEAVGKLLPDNSLWSAYPYHAFVATVEPLTVAIEFKDDLTAEWQTLKRYWEDRPTSVQERVEIIPHLGSNVFSVWMDAHEATRDKSMAAPDAIQSAPHELADPNADGRMKQSAKSSGRSSAKSPARLTEPMPATAN